MPIPTPQPDGEARVQPLVSRLADAVDEFELEIDDESGDDEVWVLSIRLEVTSRAD